jgi:hypothetical protein
VLVDKCFDKIFSDQKSKDLLENFQKNLEELADEIDEKNMTRVPFNSFNPRYVMLSTGI